MCLIKFLLENVSAVKVENIKSKTSDNFGNLKYKTNENSEMVDPGMTPDKAMRLPFWKFCEKKKKITKDMNLQLRPCRILSEKNKREWEN